MNDQPKVGVVTEGDAGVDTMSHGVDARFVVCYSFTHGRGRMTQEDRRVLTNIDIALPGRDRAGGDPHSYATLDGTVRLHVDIEDENYHMDVREDAPQKSISETLTQAQMWGLEAMDEDECPVDLLPEDEKGKTWTRQWFAAATGAYVLLYGFWEPVRRISSHVFQNVIVGTAQCEVIEGICMAVIA